MLLVSNGRSINLSRIDFEDPQVYEMLHRADTMGIFQVESAAQQQTIGRIRPRNLTDMAHEVGTVRPDVGANDGVRRTSAAAADPRLIRLRGVAHGSPRAYRGDRKQALGSVPCCAGRTRASLKA